MAQGDAESFFERTTASTTINFRPASGNSFAMESLYMYVEYNTSGELGLYDHGKNQWVRTSVQYRGPPWHHQEGSTSNRSGNTHTNSRLFLNNNKGLRLHCNGNDNSDAVTMDAHLIQVK